MDSEHSRSELYQTMIQQVRNGESSAVNDLVVVEEPLEMNIEFGPEDNRQQFTLAITMRTPGDDQDLMLGFLLTEGVIDSPGDVIGWDRSDRPGMLTHQSIKANLDHERFFDPGVQQRNFYTTSSCGVCGKASIDMVRQVSSYRLHPSTPAIAGSLLAECLSEMRKRQEVFESTGGIHAAAIFSKSGELLMIREDVGRHNAVDKLVGACATAYGLPLSDHIVIVSGRAGFELVQKAAVSGVAIFAAVGAPSSLSVQLAEQSDMTLVGFLKSNGFNVYANPQRVSVGSR